jgi:hypothetical protein
VRIKGFGLAAAGSALAVLLSGCGGGNGGGTTATPAAAGTSASAAASSAPASADAADNGVAALGADAILEKAKAALKTAKSFRIKGSVREEGQLIGFDMKASGADLVGSLTIGKAKAEVLRVGKKAYLRPNQEFWKTSGAGAKDAKAIATVVNGRWVVVAPDDKDFAELFSIADVKTLLDVDGKLTKGAVTTIDGHKAVALKETGADGGTLYVATEGEPYPLRLEGPAKADGALTFSDFGATFADLKLPPASQTIDLAKLGG